MIPDAVWRELPEVTTPPGERLIKAGDPAGCAYVLVRGAVRVEVQDTSLAWIGKPGSIIGEMGALLGVPRGADVIADGEVVCRRIDDLLAMCLNQPEVGVAIAQMLAHRLHLMDRYLVDVKRQQRGRGECEEIVDHMLGVLASSPDQER